MIQRKGKVRLKHMREHCTETIELAQGKTREDLDRDRVFELALTRLVEIVSEAAAKITPETRGKFRSNTVARDHRTAQSADSWI